MSVAQGRILKNYVKWRSPEHYSSFNSNSKYLAANKKAKRLLRLPWLVSTLRRATSTQRAQMLLGCQRKGGGWGHGVTGMVVPRVSKQYKRKKEKGKTFSAPRVQRLQEIPDTRVVGKAQGCCFCTHFFELKHHTQGVLTVRITAKEPFEQLWSSMDTCFSQCQTLSADSSLLHLIQSDSTLLQSL